MDSFEPCFSVQQKHIQIFVFHHTGETWSRFKQIYEHFEAENEIILMGGAEDWANFDLVG